MPKKNLYNGPFTVGAMIAFREDIYKEVSMSITNPNLWRTQSLDRQIVIKMGSPCRIKRINPSALTVEIIHPVDPHVTVHTIRNIEKRMYFVGGKMGEALYGKPVQKN